MKQCESVLLDVSRETTERLQTYVAEIVRWNSTINLVSKRDISDLWSRHVLDALQLIPLIPAETKIATDLGSGAGLPGMVLSIATGCHFNLVEADQRKAAFLRETARSTKASVTIHATRIEVADLPPTPLVTARALAPLTDLLGLAERLIAPGGMLIAPKGRSFEAELTKAREQWHMRVVSTQSVTDPTASILQITEVRRRGSFT